MDLGLGGKVAWVTGSARGLGRQTARTLAAEGAAVAVSDIRPEIEATAWLINEAGGRAVAFRCDVSDSADVRAAVERIQGELGPVLVLVNNAGILDNYGLTAQMPRENWDRELSVNLTGAFNCIQACLPAMIDARWGRIINMSSVAGLMGIHGGPAYAASKAGLLGLMRTVALENIRHGITCNSIAPGVIETGNPRGRNDKLSRRLENTIPARRKGVPEDIANAIAFLVSERAGYITGVELPIDAGLRLWYWPPLEGAVSQ